MKKPAGERRFPPTTVRLDPELIYQGRMLALKNKKAGKPDDTFPKLLGVALADYLRKRAG